MEWTRGPTIGRGSSASVSLATTASGELFAVKSAEISSSISLQREQFLISQLSSPHVIKCFGSDITCENKKEIYNLFLEYVPGGTLSDLIEKQGGSLDERLIQFYTHEILQGLNYLHLKGLVHCDVKGQNVLIAAGGVKIADFGCAKWMGGAGAAAFAGSPAYMAPEVARAEEQSFPADVWALGCTVIEMATGSNPWPEMKDPVSALYRIAYSGEVPEYPSWVSGNVKDFLSKCLMRDPKDRWTAAELLQHPFLCSVKEISGEISEFTRKSPTSVMDQSFWDDIEVSDSSRNPMDVASSSDSPASRVRGLINYSNFPNWTEDDDWVTVRSNGSQECSSEVLFKNSDMNQDYEEDLIEGSVIISSIIIIDEEEIQGLIEVEESMISDEINGVVYDRDSSEFPVIRTNESVRDVCLDFEKMLMESSSFLLSIQINFSNGFLAFALHSFVGKLLNQINLRLWDSNTLLEINFMFYIFKYLEITYFYS